MASKKEIAWVGGGVIKEPETDAGTTPAEVIQLVPAIPVTAGQGQPAKCLIKGVYLHFSTRRILTTTFDALGFIMWVATRTENSDLPVQSLNAIATASVTYSNKAIMLNAPLQVPPLLGTSDLLAFTVNDQVIAEHHTFEAKRKLDRQSQVLCLNLNSDVSLVTRVFVQWRVCLEYQ